MSFITEYVLGFAFGPNGHVALIQKTHPHWQKGKWNGIGGHREGLEQPREAMRREFREETGVDTDPHGWVLRGRLWAEHKWRVHVFTYQFDSYVELKAMTDEHPQWFHVGEVKAEAYPVGQDVFIENVRALIELCRLPSDFTGCKPIFTLDYS